MKKGITLKDIARKLNMSISTVSKALSNDAAISMLTRERVNAMAQNLNYVPNEAARNFKLKKSYTISFIIPDLLDQFFVLAINGVEAVAKEERYSVIFSQTHEEVINEEKIMQVMIRNRVDGIIIAIGKDTCDMQVFENLNDMGIPVVFIARVPPSPLFDYVVSKNEEAAFDATEYLIKKGHRRIAHLMAPATMATSHVRLQGYKKALVKHNISINENLIKEVDFSPACTAKAMDELLQLPDCPTAAFAYKTYIALDAMEFLKKAYPDKVDLMDFVGFGNLPLLQHLDHKPVATIEENAFEMGQQAAKLLFSLIEKENDSEHTCQHIQIDYALVEH